jgi:hypothetical protein
MTTVNTALDRLAHPQRKPQVRSCSFVDGKGPPPWTYFDETQDHLGGILQAPLGWNWSRCEDEFEIYRETTDYLGRHMRVTSTTGTFVVSKKSTDSGFGTHGVWEGVGGSGAWSFAARSAYITLDGDFLATAKVQIYSRATLDTNALGGFVATAGEQFAAPCAPGFSCGSDSANWQIVYPESQTGTSLRADSGIPVIDGEWYRLQVCRLAGAMRWFINGQMCKIGNAPGLYFPYAYTTGCKQIQASRRHVGATGEGFAIDAFHLLAERSVS